MIKNLMFRLYCCLALIFGTTLFTALPASATTLSVCHGYECYYRTKVKLTKHDEQKIRRLLIRGHSSPQAERKALASAIALFEQRSTQTIGVRDNPRMKFGKARIKGQMDCIDESTNTDQFLRHLHSRGLLKHHSPARKDARGSFFDGRYPHWTATLKDSDGELWAIDSWYEAGGQPPQIMPLAEWKKRGYHSDP